MPATNRGELPVLLVPVYECLDCGRPISADFMRGILTRYGWCEDCFGRHVYKASKSEPGICGEPGCGETYRHQVHIRASAVLGRMVPPPDRAYLLAEKSAAAEESDRQARHDPLTGLPNRASVSETLRAEIAASRTTGRPLTLAFLSLNLFKAVNDSLGHGAGDTLLVEIGRRLAAGVRAGDTVARLDGVEFALILSGTGAAEAVEVGNRVRAEVELPFMIGGAETDIGVAIGLATYPDSGAPDDDILMHQADIAMYRAKRAHLGPTVYDLSFEGPSSSMPDLAEMRHAIAGDGLVLLFQPICEGSGLRIVGAEALVRWTHPVRGLIGAMEFIPFATKTGLIGALDRQVLDLACRQTRAWRDNGLSLRMSINISRDSLQDPGFSGYVYETLAAHGLSGSDIEIEITEEGILDNHAQAGRFVAQMREIGVRMSIDDFGTGYSSLTRLRDLPVQALKIDQGFVRRALIEPADAAIVESVIALGHRLGMEVVAEGVEDQETLTYLVGLGIDFIQGYFLGRPMPQEDIVSMVAGSLLADAAPWPSRAPRACRP